MRDDRTHADEPGYSIHVGPSRARTKMRVEQIGWVETATAKVFDMLARQLSMETGIALDESRVVKAMDPGWRYSELEGVELEHMCGALQTSAWFSVDPDALNGALAGVMPETDELPPLPYRRIALDCGQAPNILFDIDLMAEGSNNEKQIGLIRVPSVVVFEIQQGRWWDVLVCCFNSTAKGENFTWGDDDRGLPLLGYHLTPGGHTADYAFLRAIRGWQDIQVKLDRMVGEAIWKTVVTAVHMIEATNVVYTKQVPNRHQRRAWKRTKYRYREPQIYRVDIVQYEAEPREGHTGREYHVRWMVRGHYRHTPNGTLIHPRTGKPATWVKAYVKGPAGAPWRGRPMYRTPIDKEEP